MLPNVCNGPVITLTRTHTTTTQVPDMQPQYKVPDLTGFRLKPYVARKLEVSSPDVPGAGAAGKPLTLP
jgi:hypothetical protein